MVPRRCRAGGILENRGRRDGTGGVKKGVGQTDRHRCEVRRPMKGVSGRGYSARVTLSNISTARSLNVFSPLQVILLE